VVAEETIAATRNRAERATSRICELARHHGTVMVVGHGMFNRFVAARLRARRWRGPVALPSAYWSAAAFQSPVHEIAD
jgi:broad specificity phosphatase PhoE